VKCWKPVKGEVTTAKVTFTVLTAQIIWVTERDKLNRKSSFTFFHH